MQPNIEPDAPSSIPASSDNSDGRPGSGAILNLLRKAGSFLIFPLICLAIGVLWISLKPQKILDKEIWTDDPLGYYQTLSPGFIGSRKYVLTIESLDGSLFNVRSTKGKPGSGGESGGERLKAVSKGTIEASIPAGDSITFLVSPSQRPTQGQYGFRIKLDAYFRL